MLDPEFESYPAKILKALNLQNDFRDKYRGDGVLVMEKISTKEEFAVPYWYVEVIKNNRGYYQLAAMKEFEALLLSQKNKRPS